MEEEVQATLSSMFAWVLRVVASLQVVWLSAKSMHAASSSFIRAIVAGAFGYLRSPDRTVKQEGLAGEGYGVPCSKDPEEVELEKWGYGYRGSLVDIDSLRKDEFSRLQGTTYVDHAGATLYSESQLKEALKDLSSTVYGNPHSQSNNSSPTLELINLVREQVLAFCGTTSKDYACVFTAGATAALKLVGETFTWSSGSQFLYSVQNHNSVLGIREYALSAGASAAAVDIQWPSEGDTITCTPRATLKRHSKVQNSDEGPHNLFAFPAECNFSGARFDFQLVNQIREGKAQGLTQGHWAVLLDAAKACGTSPPDLSQYSADFVALSFYKIFGYPTGLGALLIRRGSEALLQKRYFGGGTVAVSVADADYVHRRQGLEEWFEDGTISFLSIAALRHGFAAIDRLGIKSIARHTAALTKYTADRLAALKHANEAPVCVLYGQHSRAPQHQGPVVTFNIRRSDGSFVGYREVEKLAGLRSIQLRTGCFCNPGACAKYLGLTQDDLKFNFEAGHVCWDDNDIINGRPTGAVRVSYGYMSNLDDAKAVLKLLQDYFVEERCSSHVGTSEEPTSGSITLEGITVYPIKSCGGMQVQAWPVGPSGLLYDREWLLVDDRGNAVTQRKSPKLCLLKAFLDLSKGLLIVTAHGGQEPLEIPLGSRGCSVQDGVRVCGDVTSGDAYGPEVSAWFSEGTGVKCSLVRQRAASRHMRDSQGESSLSFANEGQFLLVNRGSVNELKERVGTVDIEVGRFRPNFVVRGCRPFAEDTWQALTIGALHFKVAGGCTRCSMINIDQRTGERSKSEPLLTLASFRRDQGRIKFGVLLSCDLRSQASEALDVDTWKTLEFSKARQAQELRVGMVVNVVV